MREKVGMAVSIFVARVPWKWHMGERKYRHSHSHFLSHNSLYFLLYTYISLTTTCKEGDGGTGTWATNEKWGELLLASASGLLGFVCISFILRLLPLFLMIISLAPGHSYHLFSYYLHWKPTYLFKR